jgi:hypothetical protein
LARVEPAANGTQPAAALRIRAGGGVLARAQGTKLHTVRFMHDDSRRPSLTERLPVSPLAGGVPDEFFVSIEHFIGRISAVCRAVPRARKSTRLLARHSGPRRLLALELRGSALCGADRRVCGFGFGCADAARPAGRFARLALADRSR